MAFELTDFNRLYVPKGEYRGLFNIARSDEVASSPRYYAFYNEAGSYIIQQLTTSNGLVIYKYYARAGIPAQMANDFTNRASLSYVEYYQLFI